MIPSKQVLVFDDKKEWRELIADTLKPVAKVQTVDDPNNWNLHISAPYWDAIVVDVQILGYDESGAEIAEKSIYKFGITAPIIIISGIVNLADLKKTYGDIFYAYVSKDNFSEILPAIVQQATTESERRKHFHKMLIATAKKNGCLKKPSDDKVVSYYASMCQSIGKGNGRTIEEIINGINSYPIQEINKIGKAMFGIISNEIRE